MQHLNRVDRVVAAARLALATFSLLAVWLDPLQPVRYSELTYSLLIAYLMFGLCLAGLAWRRVPSSATIALVGHGVDLLAFSALLFLTSGPASPFFVLFTFALLSGTLRWQWRGVLWTALVALLVHLLLPVLVGSPLLTSEDELNRYVMRAIYLVVAALMLAYVGMHQTRLRGQLWRLADWPRHWKLDFDAPVGHLLEHARAVVQCPRAMMAWTEPEEPWLNLAWTGGAGVQYRREPPGTFEPLVPEALQNATFVCIDCGNRDGLVLFGDARHSRWARVASIHPAFAARFAITHVLAVPLPAASMEGWLFLLDRRDFSPEDFMVAEMLATQCAVLLEQVELLARATRGSVRGAAARRARPARWPAADSRRSLDADRGNQARARERAGAGAAGAA